MREATARGPRRALRRSESFSCESPSWSIGSAVRGRARARRRERRSGHRRTHLDVHGHLVAGIVRQTRAELAAVVFVAHVVADDLLAALSDVVAALHIARDGNALDDDVARGALVVGGLGVAVHAVADEPADDRARGGAVV